MHAGPLGGPSFAAQLPSMEVQALEGATLEPKGGPLNPSDITAAEGPLKEGDTQKGYEGPPAGQVLDLPNVFFAAVEIPGKAKKT